MVSRVNSGGVTEVYTRNLPNEKYLGPLHVNVQGKAKIFKVYSESTHLISKSQEESLRRIIEGTTESPARSEVDIDNKHFIVVEIPDPSTIVPDNQAVKKPSSIFSNLFWGPKELPESDLSKELKNNYKAILHQGVSSDTASVGALKERIMGHIDKYQYRSIPYDPETIKTCLKEQQKLLIQLKEFENSFPLNHIAREVLVIIYGDIFEGTSPKIINPLVEVLRDARDQIEGYYLGDFDEEKVFQSITLEEYRSAKDQGMEKTIVKNSLIKKIKEQMRDRLFGAKTFEALQESYLGCCLWAEECFSRHFEEGPSDRLLLIDERIPVNTSRTFSIPQENPKWVKGILKKLIQRHEDVLKAVEDKEKKEEEELRAQEKREQERKAEKVKAEKARRKENAERAWREKREKGWKAETDEERKNRCEREQKEAQERAERAYQRRRAHSRPRNEGQNKPRQDDQQWEKEWRNRFEQDRREREANQRKNGQYRQNNHYQNRNNRRSTSVPPQPRSAVQSFISIPPQLAGENKSFFDFANDVKLALDNAKKSGRADEARKKIRDRYQKWCGSMVGTSQLPRKLMYVFHPDKIGDQCKVYNDCPRVLTENVADKLSDIFKDLNNLFEKERKGKGK